MEPVANNKLSKKNNMDAYLGADKSTIAGFVVGGLTLAMLLYMFREMAKMKNEMISIKNRDVNTDLFEKVEQNMEDIKAIEIKFDQLITALTDRENKQQQMAQQQMAQQQMAQQQMSEEEQLSYQMAQKQKAQQQQQQQQMAQQQMAQQQNLAENPPVMGGRLAGSASDNTTIYL